MTIVFILLFFTLFKVSAADSAHKIALVIGNSNYAEKKLTNPANDAKDIADALTRYGFQVIYKLDADIDEVNDALIEFESAMQPDSIAFFYYAGHGVQIKGENYLMPIGSINSQTEKQLKRNSTHIDDILERMKSSNALNVVILDACRDNPLKTTTRSSATRGFKIISRNSRPKNSLIMYSTGADRVAQDGTGRNSPFAKALLETMNKSGEKLLDVFIQTGIKVRDYTNQSQDPEIMIRGDVDFWLHGEPSDNNGSAISKNEQRWLEISTSRDVVIFKEFITQFPTSRFVPEAQQKIDKLTAEIEAKKGPDLSKAETLFMFSGLSGATIEYNGKLFSMNENFNIGLNSGNNTFTLIMEDKQKIYGNIKLLYVDPDPELRVPYGFDVPLPKESHIARVRKGAPVRYTVTTKTSMGTRVPGMRYTLSLLPMRLK